MAIARLTGQDALAASTTTSVTATYPGATTAGNTLLASVYMNVTTGLATISGWTLLKEGAFSGTAQNVAIWGKIATGSETTVTASGATGATLMRIHIYEYSGMASSLTTDGTQNATSGVTNVTTLASGNITTTNASDLLFMALGTGGATTAHAFTNSFTKLQSDASAIRLVDANQIVTSTGTYSSTPTWTTSLRAGIAYVALQGASSPATNNSGFLNFM